MNIKENNFSKVCTEMLEVFKYIPDEEFNKIESDFIETIYQEHDMYYNFKFDETKQLEEQNFLPETYDMLAYVYKTYLSNEQEKEAFNGMLFKDLSNQSEIKTEAEIEEKSIVLEENESFFKKIINFIKRTLKTK
ncbi:MAG: hypothetical protein IJW20_00455 [Clostridia bacterium]|nr:hypothetical protein [Clostridia bacterium]